MSLEEYEEAFLTGLREGLRDVAIKVKREGNDLIKEEAMDEGTLAGSAIIQQREDFTFEANWKAEHAAYVHFGTEPHFPPFKPIREWVGRKWNDLGQDLKTTDDGRSLTKDEVAEKVQWIISEYGTDPVPYAQFAVAETEPEIDGIMRRSIERHTDGVES